MNRTDSPVTPPLAAHADGPVENVLIYVSDSHRADHLPDAVRELGVHGRAVAASTFTASGFPSILTGTYPATHRVWNFEDSLPERPALFEAVEHSGVDAATVWQNVEDEAKKPPLRVCGETAEARLSDLESPFALVVHDRGGHMVYGPSEESGRWDSHAEFFADFTGRSGAIERRYRTGVAESVERFRGLLADLRSRGLLGRTLVVFTSDHGELLGEYGGLYDHGSPLVPELVRVPLVFCGAGLPAGRPLAGVLSTTDVQPTAMGALGGDTAGAEGYDLWTGTLPRRRVARAEVWKQTSYDAVEYRASGVWTDEGGFVRHLNGLWGRLLHLLGVHFYLAPYAPLVRRPSRGYRRLARSYLRRTVGYGTPPPSALVEDALVTAFERREDSQAPPGPDTEQLRQLGYLE